MKYTDEMENALENFASNYTEEVPYNDAVAYTEEFNNEFDVDYSPRAITSKLRHMGFPVGKKASAAGVKKYSAEEEAKIRELVDNADGEIFQEDIAEALGRDVKSIGGKLIAMKIYGIKKKFHEEKEEKPKLFTPEDEATILDMVENNDEVFIEDIAEAVGKSVKQCRGKLASMRVKGVKTRNAKTTAKTKIYTDELLADIKDHLDNGISVEDIAEKFNLKLAGLISMLGRKGLVDSKSKRSRFWTAEKDAELKDYVDNGYTLEALAEAFNTTVAVVGKRLKKFGLTAATNED